MDTTVVAISVDSVPSLAAWAESLGTISFDLASDFWPHGEVARRWGVFRDLDGHSERAVFLVDREGIVRYADIHDIDEQPDNAVLFARIAELEPELARMVQVADEFLAAEESLSSPWSAGAAQPVDSDTAHAAPDTTGSPRLLMYCTPWCHDCRNARRWLESRGIDYVEVDVSEDEVARERAAGFNEGRLHTPTFEFGEEVCVDFRPDRLRELLGLPDE